MRDTLLVLIVLAITTLFCIVAVKAEPYRYGTYLPLIAGACEVRDAWNNTCYSFWPR